MASARDDYWSSEAYQKAAAFVPKLATKVVEWLDVQPDDRILDVGCGNGHLTLSLAQQLSPTAGHIHGIDLSPSMIASAQSLSDRPPNCTFSVADATAPLAALQPSLPAALLPPTKIFSNAALHWILRAPSTRRAVFHAFHALLPPNGRLCIELGGHGNVAEMRAALLLAVARRVGFPAARAADPWFFPDEPWLRDVLRDTGFDVLRCEVQYRPTRLEDGEGSGGGVEGWIRLMGRRLLEAVPAEAEREEVVREVVQALQTVCPSPSGGSYVGYVRLRALARKV